MRAAVVLCLVVVLPVLAFEEGIHSAHHLPDYGWKKVLAFCERTLR